jgi:RNA polymerase sigma-70 factor (ECF subfamily)
VGFMNMLINLSRIGSQSDARVFRPRATRLRKYSRAFKTNGREFANRPNSSEAKERKPCSSGLDETIRLAQQGNAGAFETLYQLHSRRVYALCLRMLNDPLEAEDLTQEAFLQLFRKIHTFRGESAFSSWLHRLTANLVLMRFRKKKLQLTSLDEAAPGDDENSRPALEIGAPDLQLIGLFDRMILQKAIAQLPQGYKSMFILHDVQGYEHKEIARMFGCSTGNCKSQLHKARKRLRELLRRANPRPDEIRQAAGASLRLAAAG